MGEAKRKSAVVKMDALLFELGKFYYQMHLEDHPGSAANQAVIVMSTLRSLEMVGHATKHIDAAGDVTWRATPELLINFKGGAGPLVVFGPGVH